MSVQDKVERVLKEIHILFSECPEVSGQPDKIIVSKQDVFSLLEKLNLCMYEVMDSYEATAQSRELAQRRSEKKGRQIVERAGKQAEDVYAASLIYTDDALNRVQKIMSEAAASAQQIIGRMESEFNRERLRVRENQSELREQLQDFKDSNKYLVIMEDCNRERLKEEKEKAIKENEKRIQNKAKHYKMEVAPEIKVTPSYLKRREAEGSIPPMPSNIPAFLDGETELSDQPVKMAEMPEIQVNLDAEYFKWQAGTNGGKTAGRGADEDQTAEIDLDGINVNGIDENGINVDAIKVNEINVDEIEILEINDLDEPGMKSMEVNEENTSEAEKKKLSGKKDRRFLFGKKSG